MYMEKLIEEPRHIEIQVLADLYGLQEDDRLSVNGLMEMGFQTLSRKVGDLPAGSISKLGPKMCSPRLARDWHASLDVGVDSVERGDDDIEVLKQREVPPPTARVRSILPRVRNA